jgi:aconitate hydratase 2/2-methylisocitrate dehydratase
MLEAYHRHVAERAKLGIPPLPLNAQQTAELCEILKNPPEELKGELLTLNEVLELSDTNPYAKQVIDAWANGAWFIAKPKLANRPDIPLHALVC